ncbi:MAG: methyltransferase domain-containing protein [Saprospiraceae bacterium]|nr:methyltransferase domain-containing protein [Saprospiraceae bacterium]
MGALKFFIQGIKNFKEVGTFSRSSHFVAKTMTKDKHIDWENTKCVVELGAGDGPITKQILQKLRPDAKLLCFEINKKFAEELTEKFAHDKRITIINDDAKKLGEYIKDAGFQEADYVLSEIPFVIIPEDDIIEQAHKNLKNGGKFIQLHYSLAAKKRYERIFNNSEIDFVMLNVPPAFIHICEKL